jgi:hypothetical protein
MRVRALLQVLVGVAPWPAEQAETRNDARPSDDGPERAAGHRRSLDQVKPLPEPYRAGHDEQPSDLTRRARVTASPPFRGAFPNTGAAERPSGRAHGNRLLDSRLHGLHG